MKTSDKNPEKSKKTTLFLILISLFLLMTCGYLWWQNVQLQKALEKGGISYDQISSEKDQMKLELEAMLLQYDGLKTENEDLNASLEEEKLKIEDLLKKMKGKDWSIHKLKKETETLRTIMKGYVSQIDSLNTVNNNLKIENKTVQTALSSEKDKNENLTRENEGLNDKLTIASHLKAVNLKSYGVKVRNDNTGKESDRAKRVEKIRTVFTILQNKVNPPGEKWIYLRILTPDGRVLSKGTDESNKFDFNNVRGIYSVKQSINYQNKEVTLKMDWEKTEDFAIGEYTVEVYADGVDIGRTKFLLK